MAGTKDGEAPRGRRGGQPGEGSVTVLDHIGRTRMIPLRHMVPPNRARVLVKLEYENPTGSMKDRMARAMVEAAEEDGRLRPGGSVVEYTGGSTGVSLAFVCAAKRIPLRIVTSEVFSREKRDHMAALGAHLTLVPGPTGAPHISPWLALFVADRRYDEGFDARDDRDGQAPCR